MMILGHIGHIVYAIVYFVIVTWLGLGPQTWTWALSHPWWAAWILASIAAAVAVDRIIYWKDLQREGTRHL